MSGDRAIVMVLSLWGGDLKDDRAFIDQTPWLRESLMKHEPGVGVSLKQKRANLAKCRDDRTTFTSKNSLINLCDRNITHNSIAQGTQPLISISLSTT